MEQGRWGLCIDIEGFSSLYEHSEQMKTKAIMALRELMNAIISIANNVYPGSPEKNYSERLFVNQFGDGFIITSDFPEKSSLRCVAISISLMRHMLIKGYTTKVAISTGDMSDIKGCYPKYVKNSKNDHVYIGHGVMTIIPVMGTALTRSHKLLSQHSGSILMLDANRFEENTTEAVLQEIDGITHIAWHSDKLALAKQISSEANLEYGSDEALVELFNNYIQQEPVPPISWINSTKAMWY